jgi:hypothetical protein
MAFLDGAGIAAAVKELCGLDLDPPEASMVLDDKVVLGGVSPGLGYVKAVFCGGGHEAQLNPLAAPLWLFDLHCQFIHWVPVAKLAKNKKATQVGPPLYLAYSYIMAFSVSHLCHDLEV